MSQEGLRTHIITPVSHFVRLGEPGGGALLASYLVRVENGRTSSPARRGAMRLRLKEQTYDPRHGWENAQIYWQKSPRGEKQSAPFLVHSSGSTA